MRPRAKTSPATAGIRVAVRVKPGVSRPRVGGSYGPDAEPRLVVAVSARAVDGQANAAVVKAVASELGLRQRDVEIISGHTGRNKTLRLTGDVDHLTAAVIKLLQK